MNAVIIKALLDAVHFFANCEDDVLDPDVAVSQLEAIAAILSELDEIDRKSFRDICLELAKETRECAEFFHDVAENLGL